MPRDTAPGAFLFARQPFCETGGMAQVAVITGAGSGIGRAVAIELLQAGYRVVLAGRHEDTLRETAESGPDASVVVPTDVADEDSVSALFGEVRRTCGRIDVLFNN